MSKIDQSMPVFQWAFSALGFLCEVTPLPKAASRRVYYRLKNNESSWVLMDAEAERESVPPFIKLAEFFEALDLRVPRIKVFNLPRGWLISEDFGDKRLLEELNQLPESANRWYRVAWDNLLRLQCAKKWPDSLPCMDQAFARRESMRFITDFLPTLLPEQTPNFNVLQDRIDELAFAVAGQPSGLSHRDFHAGNLMCLPTGELGVLDFQSAFRAPLVYDAVSLLRDCYIDWQPEQVDNWLLEFFTSSKLWQAHFADFTELKQAFDAVSLQRHLKCLGLFAHLLKSGQKDYESAMLRTLRYAKEVCEQQECWTAFLSAINAGINRYNQ